MGNSLGAYCDHVSAEPSPAASLCQLRLGLVLQPHNSAWAWKHHLAAVIA
jgi:hypothetical protein